MVLLAVLPAALVTIIGAAVAGPLYAEMPGGDSSSWWMLPGAGLLLACLVLAGAGLVASAQARALMSRCAELSRFAAQGQAQLDELVHRIRQGRRLVRHQPRPLPEPADALDRVAQQIAFAQHAAEAALVQVGALTRGADPSGSEEQFEVFANLARRLESLVHREIGLLDDLENEVEDPDLLRGLFQVDHLATRIRRYAENLAVLGGAVTHRQWSRPVRISDVLRSAIAEIQHYSRVKMVPPLEGTLRGHAVVDVVHLLAELAENATVFSPPQTQVLLRVQGVAAGVAIEVEDRGLGMAPAERNQMNALLSSPDRITLGELLRDGRIGLYVVATLAQRHGIRVQLQANVYGGTQAVVVLPHELLGQEPDAVDAQQRTLAAAAPRGPADNSLERTPRREAPVAARSSAPATEQPPGLDPGPRPAPDDGRPSLPKRRRQEHLSPELRKPLRDSGTPEDVEHDPGLMAAFQSGVRRAEGSKEADTSPAVRGDTRPGLFQ
jgi:signal transduction histidine kinase